MRDGVGQKEVGMKRNKAQPAADEGVSPLSICWLKHHICKQVWMFTMHLGNRSPWLCDLFVVPCSQPQADWLPGPGQMGTQGHYTDSAVLCALVKGLHMASSFQRFLVCPKYLGLQHLRPVHVACLFVLFFFFFYCWIWRSLAFMMCLCIRF